MLRSVSFAEDSAGFESWLGLGLVALGGELKEEESELGMSASQNIVPR